MLQTIIEILEKYNNQITKLNKLLAMMVFTYWTIISMPEIKISNENIFKLVACVGIIFIILDNYYPSIPSHEDSH